MFWSPAPDRLSRLQPASVRKGFVMGNVIASQMDEDIKVFVFPCSYSQSAEAEVAPSNITKFKR